MQLKPKKTVENREKLRFRFSGKNRGFGSVPVTALVLVNCFAAVTGERRATEYLLQRLSVAIQRGNAASVLGTVGGESHDSKRHAI